jgi:hypothetical protein
MPQKIGANCQVSSQSLSAPRPTLLVKTIKLIDPIHESNIID